MIKALGGHVRMKTIGILGGIGPQATMDFEVRVHQAARKLIAPLYNSGYPPMVVYYHRYAPVLLHDDMTPVFPIQPDPGLLEGVLLKGNTDDADIINPAQLLAEAAVKYSLA
jgi:hypothetical protein